jgi:glycosyltransferase involved in cell wall biosynthesis
MKISVTVQFHNELEFLPGFFEAASKYADEIICAAHAPTDGSLEYVKSLQAESKVPITIMEFPEDTVYQHGFSYMKNACIEKATGDWIVSLDADEEMEVTKEGIERWSRGRHFCVSTITMHTTEFKPHWSLENREVIKQEAQWIRQRHWRIFKNIGIRWYGLIHEELRLPEGRHIGLLCRNSDMRMWHLGSCANPAKRGFKDGLYAELLLRVVEQPELREGTNKWWWTTFYEENKESLHKQRDEYRKQRELV